MRKILALATVMLFAMSLSAQLTTREDIPSVLRYGTRPLAGNFGLYVGPSIFSILDLTRADNIKQSTFLLGLPLVNIKYYKSDILEYRLGIQVANDKTKLVGEPDTSTVGLLYKNRLSESVFRLTPAVVKHFGKQNLLDVYMGAGIVLGRNYWLEDKEYDPKNSMTVSQNVIVSGFSYIIGLQTFIADLPVAIGLEYGISALHNFGLQYKVTEVINEVKQVYYLETNGTTDKYTSLKHKKFLLGNDLRITLSYYFFR